MNRSCLVLFLLLAHLNIMAQIHIKGQIKDENRGISNAGIRLYQKGNNQILTYSLSDQNGFFTLNYSEKKDSLYIAVSAFNFAAKLVDIKSSDTNIIIPLTAELTVLKEVKIKKNAIVKKNDTLIFDVKSFASKGDRSIGDVIARLPGVEITNGIIRYEGKPISTYYTQGKNLLGNQYIMANESVSYENISTVSLMRNHQPIKVLQGEEDTNIPALNIEFKKSALNKPNSKAGFSTVLGSENLSWNAALFSILIGERIQATADYQANNVGNTIKDAQQISSVLDRGILSAESTFGQNPSKKDYYFLFNNANAVKSKFLVPISKKQDLKIELFYLNDHLSKASESKTKYFLPNDKTLEIIEPHSNLENKNQFKFDAALLKNLKKDYFENTFSFSGSWKSIHDNIMASPIIEQKLNNSRYKFENHLKWIHSKGNTRYSLNSSIVYDERPEYLKVNPSALFSANHEEYRNLNQKVTTRNFQFINSAQLNLKTAIGNISLTPNFLLDFKKLNSQLFEEIDGKLLPLGTVFSNHYERFKLRTGTEVAYEYKSSGEKVKFNLQIPLLFDYLSAKDIYLNINEKENRLYANVNADLKYALSDRYALTAGYALLNSITGLSDTGYGSMMLNYRTLIINRAADYVNTRNNSHRYTLNVEHSNIDNYLGAKASLFYNISINSQLAAQEINEESSSAIIVPYRSKIFSKGGTFNLNKYLIKAKTSIGTNASFSISNYDRILENNIVKADNTITSLGCYLKSSLIKWLEINYNFALDLSSTNDFSAAEKNNRASILKQSLILTASLNKWTVKYEMEDNYIQFNKKRYFFADAVILYKLSKKVDLSLNGRNLTNLKNITSVSFFNNSQIQSSYELRPISILVGASFIL